MATRNCAYCVALRFLLHGQLGPDVAAALIELGHKPATPADLTLATNATPAEVVEACRAAQLELVVANGNFLDDVLPLAGQKRVLVYLHDAPDKHAESVARLFERYKRLTPGRLYTVTAGRVKVRQIPTAVAAA